MIPSGPTRDGVHQGLLRHCHGAESEAADGGDRRRRRRVLRQRLRGARDNAKVAGLNVVYDKRYPPSTTDFAPIVRAIQATNPDIVVICSYPPDSVGMVKAINEIGFKPKMTRRLGRLQATAIKTQLGPLLNGFVNYDFWVPVPKMDFPGVADFLRKYQARAGSEGVDPLGYYIGPGLCADGGPGAGNAATKLPTTTSLLTTSAPTLQRPWSAT